MGHGAGFRRGAGFSLLLQVLIAQDLVHQEGSMQGRVGVHGPRYRLHAPSKRLTCMHHEGLVEIILVEIILVEVILENLWEWWHSAQALQCYVQDQA